MAIQRIPPATSEGVNRSISQLEREYGTTAEFLSNALDIPDDVSADWHYLLSQRAYFAEQPRKAKVLMYGRIDLEASAEYVNERCVQTLCAA